MKNDSMDDRGIGVRMVPGERLLQDVRFALRSFTRRPGWVLIAVLSLGLGIGVNATIFDWLKAVYFNPLPGVRDARSLVTINAAYRDADGYSNSYADFLYIRDHSNLFDGLFAHEMEIAALSDGRSAEMTVGGIVSGDYFEVLGARTVMGRVFRPEEDEVADRNPVIVLGYSLWQRRFAGDAAIVGRQVELNRTPFTVIGVATPG
ncbi:MAG TPA: ABC transporter permease, partial [Bryobacteraceae bacterium]|nr:ABC transporter permease [Bryobacteraceae bacterium]